MSNAAPFAIAGSTTSVADPRSLVLRLEVCRLQAELERLEARLGELRSSSTAESAPSVDQPDPVGGSADELVDRMVATLLESGRAEIVDAIRLAATRTPRQAWRSPAGAPVPSWTPAGPTSRRRSPSAARRCGPRGPGASTRSTCSSTRALRPWRPRPPRSPPVSQPAAAEPVASEPVAGEPALPRTAEMEEARTDAAFDAWMAVGPTAAVSLERVADALEPRRGRRAGARPVDRPCPLAWLLPLEVAAALLVAALLVVLGLVLVG